MEKDSVTALVIALLLVPFLQDIGKMAAKSMIKLTKIKPKNTNPKAGRLQGYRILGNGWLHPECADKELQ